MKRTYLRDNNNIEEKVLGDQINTEVIHKCPDFRFVWLGSGGVNH